MPVKYELYNEDCVTGARRHLGDGSIDLIITDPPYGIDGHKLHKHYNRNEGYVLDGYIEVPEAEYPEFSQEWIKEASRVLRPGGSIYIVSGYSNLRHILNALAPTPLEEKNHIIWKYNFGVYTKTKFVSSHYHILFYTKPGGKHIFNTYSRYGPHERAGKQGSLNYQDREDVWPINREYKPGQPKNKNELPTQLLIKMLQYSSNEGDTVCDFFLGSFSTAKVAIAMNRNVCGFELSKATYQHQIGSLERIKPGELLNRLRTPGEHLLYNQGKPWSEDELEQLLNSFETLRMNGLSKKESIQRLTADMGRGYFSLMNALKRYGV